MPISSRLNTDQRGSIAVLGAVLFAVLIGTAALAVDLGNWYVARVDLQRTADAAAISGAFAYAATPKAEIAANAAADTAELNGAQGASSRSWQAATLTLSDNAITVQLVPSPRNPADQAVQVTVSNQVPLLLAQILIPGGGATIGASSWAEITPPATPAPACVLALAQSGNGVTNDLSIGGNATLTLSGCTLRSDASIDVFGSAGVTALGAYAAGGISGNISTTPTTGQLVANAGIIADPYAGNEALQNAFSQLGSGGVGVSVSPNQSVTLSPGTYSGLDIKGTATLNPGTYIVNGPITFDSQATVQGNGVTIIASGSVTVNGGATLNLAAPTGDDGEEGEGGASGIPGVVLASPSTTSATINGGSSSAFQGAIYFPNSNITFTGNSANGANGCTQVIAYSITFKGSATLGSSCNNAGTTPINSANSGVALVQ